MHLALQSAFTRHGLGELSQCLKQDDSNINIILVNNIIISIIGPLVNIIWRSFKLRKYKVGYDHSVSAVIGW